ncbi:ubiquitin hydrolase [Phlyctema vagabunda]|uniref:ubiquitinyl hydrolase 1 n=1 Tax=Phlyctema vagabunda TaxID=108571 RepID=A0ABR4PJF1_9HELO
MNSRSPNVQDLFDGDPDFLHEYHQDYREPIWTPLTSPGVLLPTIICIFLAGYQVLYALDYDLPQLPELLFDALVYFTPLRLLNAVEDWQSLFPTAPELRGLRKTHAAKKEMIRRIIGMDAPGGIMNTVAQAGRRRLSSISGVLTTQGPEGQPAGLGNWDNSCYQNSVLQGLASLDTLPEYLETPEPSEKLLETTSKPEMKMAEALRGLIETLNDSTNNGQRIWTPAALKSMSSWQQQDAQEYFSKVLDEIDKEVGKAAESVKTNPGLESERKSKVLFKDNKTQPISTVRNPLEGLIAQRVGCTRCGYSEGLSMIPFNCLTVPLGRRFQYDVSECLDEYTKLEPIEGVECGKCTLLKYQRNLSTLLERLSDTSENSTVRQNSADRLEVINAALEDDDYEDKTLANKCNIPSKNRVSSTKSRQAVVARPPKSLVVHFNRSLFDEQTGELRKNLSQVRFPKVLDLGPWCLGSSGTNQPELEEWLLNPDESMIASNRKTSRVEGPIYELRAVVTHQGRHENGHYIAYKKHPSTIADEKGIFKDQWWRLSDDVVMKVSEENVLSQGGVFMLFFDCIQPLGIAPTASDISEKASAAQPNPSVESIAAANIPLPKDSEDLSDSENAAASPKILDRESIPASISDNDDDENDDKETQEYRPTKAIVVPPYIQSSGKHQKQEGEILSASNLVMV